MIEQAVILAAGRGTRLGPLTNERPKSMLPILGKPIVAHVLGDMAEAGVRRFVLVVGVITAAAITMPRNANLRHFRMFAGVTMPILASTNMITGN